MNKVFIIAEAGVNHNGDLETAYRLIEIAAKSGADAVKFQTFKTDLVLCENSPKADYQNNNDSISDSQFDMIKKLELNEEAHYKLLDACKRNGIKFMSTAFDTYSIQLLDDLGLDIFKIPSGEVNNLPYLRKIGRLNKKIILSTGMANLEEIESAISILVKAGTTRSNITILHANTEYPTPMEDVNLNAMRTIREHFNLEVGYSDHTLGIEVPIAAVALGATVIEKHLTLDRSQIGPDHSASIEPEELNAMVKAIRNIQLALGRSAKVPSPSEEKNILVVRKSIVAAKPIKRGTLLTEENLAVKRPGYGQSPMKWDSIVGTTANKDYAKDEQI